MYTTFAVTGAGWENRIQPSRWTGLGTVGGRAAIAGHYDLSALHPRLYHYRAELDSFGATGFSQYIEYPLYSPVGVHVAKQLYYNVSVVSSSGVVSLSYLTGWNQLVGSFSPSGNILSFNKVWSGAEAVLTARLQLAYDAAGTEIILDQEITVTTGTT